MEIHIHWCDIQNPHAIGQNWADSAEQTESGLRKQRRHRAWLQTMNSLSVVNHNAQWMHTIWNRPWLKQTLIVCLPEPQPLNFPSQAALHEPRPPGDWKHRKTPSEQTFRPQITCMDISALIWKHIFCSMFWPFRPKAIWRSFPKWVNVKVLQTGLWKRRLSENDSSCLVMWHILYR